MKNRLLFVLFELIVTIMFVLLLLAFPIVILVWVVTGKNIFDNTMKFFIYEKWKKGN